MKTLYLECNMGAAGDMLMAALTELMPDKDAFVKELNDLQIPQVNIERTTIAKCGIMGTHMVVTVDGEEEKSIDVPMHAHTHSHVHEEHEHTHEHHHEHDENCTCGCHDHEHHHHHHADEVFTSWGKETPHKFTKEKIEDVLKTLCETDDYGTILRAKGMVEDENGTWIYFDMVPEETEIREGAPEYTGRLCVIGSKLKEDKLAELFGLA